MSLKISDLEALNTVTIGQSGFTPRLQVIGSNTGGLAEIYVSAGSGNALRLNTNFVNGNYIDINPYITGVSNGGFEINQNGTQRLVITAGGNIGIGTTTDAGYKVNVSGTIAATSAPGSYGTIIRIRDTVTSGTESFGGVHFTSSPGTDYTIGKWSTAAGAGLLQIRDQAGNQFVTVNGIGNFGVGTNSPGVKFVNSGGGNSDGPTFGSGSVGCNAILSGNGLYGLYTGVSNSGHVWQQVQRNDGSTAVYPLSLQTSGGNVLIGTTSDAGYKLDVNGITRLNGETLINASRATVGNDGGAQKKFVTIPLNGADYQHRYILLAKAPSYGAASVNAGFRGTIVMERVNGIGIDLHDDFDFTVSYNNEIYFRQTSYQPYQTQLVRLSYGGVQYLALYVYSAPGYSVSYIDAIQTNYGGWLDANTFLAIESSTSLHSAVSYTANTTTFKQSVSVQGSVTANSGFFNSDIRLKDLTDYDYNVSDIKPITYLWKDGRDNKKHVGYSAQEVQKVMPDAVNEGTDGMLSVNYVEILVAKISQMEKEIAYLKSKI